MNQYFEDLPEDAQNLFAQLEDLSVDYSDLDLDSEAYLLEAEQDDFREQARIFDELAAKSTDFAVLRAAMGERVGSEDMLVAGLTIYENMRDVGLGQIAKRGLAMMSSVSKLAQLSIEQRELGDSSIEEDLHEYQGELLASDLFSDEDKELLLGYIADSFGTAAKDMSDPNVAANALAEQQRAQEEEERHLETRARASELIANLTEAYVKDRHIDPNDPLFKKLVGSMTTLADLDLRGYAPPFSGLIRSDVEALRLNPDDIKAIHDQVVQTIRTK